MVNGLTEMAGKSPLFIRVKPYAAAWQHTPAYCSLRMRSAYRCLRVFWLSPPVYCLLSLLFIFLTVLCH